MNPCIGLQDVAKQPEPVSAKSTAEEMEKALTDLMLGKTQLQQATPYVLINDAMAFVVVLPVQL